MATISFGPGIKLGSGIKLYNPSDLSYDFNSGYVTLSPSVTVGTSAYTVDLWFNVSSFAIPVYFFGPSARTGAVFNVRLNSATVVQVDSYISTATAFTVPAMSVNIWYHLAVTRNSSGLTSVFLNGVRSSTAPTTITINYGAFNLIGGTNVSGNNGFAQIGFPGYISNFRFISGSNIYDPNATTITVPTRTLTSVTNTKLLTGTNASGVITDLSGNETLTATGTVSPSSYSPFSTYYYSGSFNGSTQYLSLANSASNQMGPFDWTAEAWIYITSYTDANQVVSKGGSTTDWTFGTFNVSGRLYFAIGGTDYFATTGPIVPLNTWCHVALVRSGTTLSTYLNGVLGNTQTGITQNFASTGTLRLGRGRDASTNYLSGYISNARLVKGTAVYTGNFTPSTIPLSRIQSARTNIAALTVSPTYIAYYYSGSFNGTSQRLTVADNISLQFGSSAFTIEGWFYFTSLSSINGLISKGAASFGTGSWSLTTNTSGKLYLAYDSSQLIFDTTLQINTWYHLALVRDGSNIVSAYINGVKETTTGTITTNFNIADSLNIGCGRNTSNFFVGYASNIRLIKGTAVYTGNFTVPTNILRTTQSASTNIAALTGTETSLLTLQDTTIVDNSTNAFTITNTGTVQITSLTTETSLLTLQDATIIDNSNNASTITNTGTVQITSLTPPPFITDKLSNVLSVTALVVAGGGGGGYCASGDGGAGGGGAGGLIYNPTFSILKSIRYTVTVGAGGTAAESQTVIGTAGQNSVFSTLTAVGGGPGGSTQIGSANATILAGGSGGGAGSDGGGIAGGAATAGQGFAGANNSSVAVGSGGGGAGGAGSGASNGPYGGVGLAYSITGSSVYYAGGGGGGKYNIAGGAGGLGGGGTGGTGGGAAVAGTTNTGGGGGGGGGNGVALVGPGAAGGSGIVIIRYTDDNPPATVTGSVTTTVANGYRLYTFTDSGTIFFN